jgi:hypothetical protein
MRHLYITSGNIDPEAQCKHAFAVSQGNQRDKPESVLVHWHPYSTINTVKGQLGVPTVVIAPCELAYTAPELLATNVPFAKIKHAFYPAATKEETNGQANA